MLGWKRSNMLWQVPKNSNFGTNVILNMITTRKIFGQVTGSHCKTYSLYIDSELWCERELKLSCKYHVLQHWRLIASSFGAVFQLVVEVETDGERTLWYYYKCDVCLVCPIWIDPVFGILWYVKTSWLPA